MPILDIEIILRPAERLDSDLSFRLAQACAEILHSKPRGTWVKLRTLESNQYAENGAQPGNDVFPVFVNVLKYVLDPDLMAEEARRLAEAIGIICNRPKENVHIFFQPEGRGRVAFGGEIQ